MPTDLHARASAQQGLLEGAAAAATDALATARAELGRRHPDAGSVARPDWAAELGAVQHQQVARDALDAVRADQAAVRGRIAAIANPADATTFEDELRELLIEEAALRVELRLADERVAAGAAAVAGLSALSARAESELQAAAARTAWGKEHTDLGTQLRASLSDAPLDTIVADAGAVLGGAELTAADDRLDELLPAELRSRAAQRAGEAADHAAAATDAAQHVRAEADAADLANRPIEAAIDIGERDLVAAEQALAAYAGGASGRLAWATAALARVAALPDLSDNQAEALDPANNVDGVTAAEQEADLATAVAAAGDAQRVVDDAVLAALLADPDADPEADQAVIDARAALADAAIQGPLDDARDAYDEAARRALDEWEVEVPASLWAGLDDFVEAQRTLQRLSSAADRTALVDALGDAEDALAAALDRRDTAVRARWALALADASRSGALAAASAVAGDRRRQYLQGDGPSGRSPAEL
jgi:hypothetical protein